MRRRIARGFFVLVCGVIATVLGVVSAVLWTPPGLRLVARFINEQAEGMVRGSLHVRSVSGRWLKGFTLDSVVIRDSAGVLFAEIPKVELRYRLGTLLAGRMVFGELDLHDPDIQIIKRRNGRLNYQEIFRLGEGPRGTGPPQLVEIQDLHIEGGRFTIRLPWNPDGRLRTTRQVDSALAFERSKPGRRIEQGPEGLELVRTLTGVEADIPRALVSSPDNQPTTLEIRHLAARISDPAMDVRDLRGRIRTKNDSLLFELEHAELPGTTGSGAGRLDWPRDTILYHFAFEAPRLALADFRWVSPKFPDFTGSASVTANSLSGVRTEWDFARLSVGDSTSLVDGKMVAITDIYRGLGFRGLRLSLGNLDLDAVRPFLDTLPFHGRISGPLRVDGFFDGMTVALDWAFHDAMVPGGADSRLALDGNLKLGGSEGMFFGGARLHDTDFDLRTVRLVAPAVILEGRLGLDGTLTGPWRNVVFAGKAVHQDDGRPASRLSGTVRLDTRGAVLALDADVVLDSLHFEGIRRAFPTLTAKGALGGRVKLSGVLDNLAVDADVTGEIGHVIALGRMTLLPPRYGADSLRLTFDGVNLAALSAAGTPSRLTGTLLATGVIDGTTAPVGRLDLALGAGTFRGLAFDSAAAHLHAADSLIVVDTLTAAWKAIRVEGAGSIGWRAPKSGKLALHLEAPDLSPFDSLALAMTGFVRDTLKGDVTMAGRGRADINVDGALGALNMGIAATVDSVHWLGYRGKNLAADVHLATVDSTFTTALRADSLYWRSYAFGNLAGGFRGRTDSMHWEAAGEGRELVKLRGGGRWQQLAGSQLFHADSLLLALQGREWELQAPFDARVADAGISLDTVRFATVDGSGSIELSGDVPGEAPGQLSVTALGLRIGDLYGLVQLDARGIYGSLAVDARLGGTRSMPTLRGTSTITGAVFGDFQAPLIRAAFDYREQLLRSNLTFWRTGQPVVEVDASLPFDLALKVLPKRQLPGPVTIVAKGDSVELAIIEAFTPNVRNVTGSIDMDARIEGTWDAPRLAGYLRVEQGASDVPSLGVRYEAINGTFKFAGDSITTDSLRIQGGEGDLIATGGIRLAELTQPIYGLNLSARDFSLMNVPNYMKIRSWGDVQLTGSFAHPVLTGTGRLTESVIYFADLITKEVINLEDPMNADLVDTLELRRSKLQSSFQSRFLDSLAIRDLDFTIGESVWLRSLEANFQLEGRVRVNKNRKVYRIDGTLDTPRGTYTLNIPLLLNRTFTVERGTVRYFGDLNAELDVEARHVVRNAPGTQGDVPVIAHIGGTLEIPKLTLRTPPDRPPIPEPQLISLLVFGTTDPRAAGQLQFESREQVASSLVAYATNALTSELQRAILGTSEGLFQIRPGLSASGFIGGGTSPTQLAVGRAITSKLFITANAGFCLSNGQAFGARNLGASVEYRFVRELRAVLSAEPLQTCFAQGLAADALSSTRRYQFGAELRWDRDY
jgi:translocation-and-assembly-module (TAM) inner membrane subunit TamB-like protein